MKLVLAVVQDYDADRLLDAVGDAGFGATRVASTGGFLRTGNTTVIMGVPDERVATCLSIVTDICQVRSSLPSSVRPELELSEWYPTGVVAETSIGGAAIFVLRVARYEQYWAGNESG